MPLNAAPYSSFGGLTPSELNQHANLICVGMPGARTVSETLQQRYLSANLRIVGM